MDDPSCTRHSISSPDGAELFIALLNIPEYGQFVAVGKEEGGKVVLGANVAVPLEGNDFYFELLSRPEEDVQYVVFYRVTDNRGLGMVGENEVRIEGVKRPTSHRSWLLEGGA